MCDSLDVYLVNSVAIACDCVVCVGYLGTFSLVLFVSLLMLSIVFLVLLIYS